MESQLGPMFMCLSRGVLGCHLGGFGIMQAARTLGSLAHCSDVLRMFKPQRGLYTHMSQAPDSRLACSTAGLTRRVYGIRACITRTKSEADLVEYSSGTQPNQASSSWVASLPGDSYSYTGCISNRTASSGVEVALKGISGPLPFPFATQGWHSTRESYCMYGRRSFLRRK